VTDVTEHHTEQEWERDYRDWCWVEFFVRRYAVSVNNCLVDTVEFVGVKMGGRAQLFVLNLFDLETSCFV